MSVMMTLWFHGDPAAIERYAGENPDKMRGIVDHAVEHGLIAHRFFGAEGQVLVVDEWPDEESFRSFFAHVADDVAPIMAAAGVTNEPHPVFWRELETHDKHGWDA